ncbi:hypothetical protein LKL90_21885, partial [Bacillus mobilis]|uniref:hypothetical protein n=1 Tax=Bacillus mobilis TaxID=2026190 RepID=UPI001E35F6DC
MSRIKQIAGKFKQIYTEKRQTVVSTYQDTTSGIQALKGTSFDEKKQLASAYIGEKFGINTEKSIAAKQDQIKDLSKTVEANLNFERNIAGSIGKYGTRYGIKYGIKGVKSIIDIPFVGGIVETTIEAAIGEGFKAGLKDKLEQLENKAGEVTKEGYDKILGGVRREKLQEKYDSMTPDEKETLRETIKESVEKEKHNKGVLENFRNQKEQIKQEKYGVETESPSTTLINPDDNGSNGPPSPPPEGEGIIESPVQQEQDEETLGVDESMAQNEQENNDSVDGEVDNLTGPQEQPESLLQEDGEAEVEKAHEQEVTETDVMPHTEEKDLESEEDREPEREDPEEESEEEPELEREDLEEEPEREQEDSEEESEEEPEREQEDSEEESEGDRELEQEDPEEESEGDRELEQEDSEEESEGDREREQEESEPEREQEDSEEESEGDREPEREDPEEESEEDREREQEDPEEESEEIPEREQEDPEEESGGDGEPEQEDSEEESEEDREPEQEDSEEESEEEPGLEREDLEEESEGEPEREDLEEESEEEPELEREDLEEESE